MSRLYTDRRVLFCVGLGFLSGLPLALSFSTLTAWLASAGVARATIGAFALVGLPYSLKFLWAPLLDRVPPPIPLGRRRGWAMSLLLAIAGLVWALGGCHPATDLAVMAPLALGVAALAASLDIVIDAYRIEVVTDAQQGAGSAAAMIGYRLAMLVSGAGALYAADVWGWTVSYHLMAGLLAGGSLLLLSQAEPEAPAAQTVAAPWHPSHWIAPFLAIRLHPRWGLLLLFIVAYKLGEGLAGSLSNTFYVKTGYSLTDIARISKTFGLIPLLGGSILGGWLAGRWPLRRLLLVAGGAQMLGNGAYALQAQFPPDLMLLAGCVFAENFTGSLAGAALVTCLARLCHRSHTASHYAALSALAGVGRTTLSGGAGVLADWLDWTGFFVLTSLICIPALLLLRFLTLPDEVSPDEAPQRC